MAGKILLNDVLIVKEVIKMKEKYFTKKNIKSALSLFVITVFVLSLSSISVSCRFPPGKDLPFETMIPGNSGDSLYKEESAQIRVFSYQMSMPYNLDWIDPYYRPQIMSVDFSKYFIVMVFNGYRTVISRVFSILRISQRNGDIFILAHFSDKPGAYDLGLQAENSQYQVVKISNQFITTGRAYTFRVFDESKVERARTTYAISAPE